MTDNRVSQTSTERSRRLRARRAAGGMIVQVDISLANLEIAQRLSGAQTPLTTAQVAEQMILALRSVASTAQKDQSADPPPVPRGRGTWDDPLLSVRKPLVWS